MSLIILNKVSDPDFISDFNKRIGKDGKMSMEEAQSLGMSVADFESLVCSSDSNHDGSIGKTNPYRNASI